MELIFQYANLKAGLVQTMRWLKMANTTKTYMKANIVPIVKNRNFVVRKPFQSRH